MPQNLSRVLWMNPDLIIMFEPPDPTTLFLAQQRPKRGTTFGDFLRGLFIDHEPPEAVRDGRNSNPNPPTGKHVPSVQEDFECL